MHPSSAAGLAASCPSDAGHAVRDPRVDPGACTPCAGGAFHVSRRDPAPNPPQTLDVILVNSKSATRPEEAQALAQANLDGGGNTDEDRRAKTPLPVTAKPRAGDDLKRARAEGGGHSRRSSASCWPRPRRGGGAGASRQAGRRARAPEAALGGADLADLGARRDAAGGADRAPGRGVQEAAAQGVHRRQRASPGSRNTSRTGA